MMRNQLLMVGKQQGWLVDQGFAAGYFHSFDFFHTPGALYAERKLQVFLPRDYSTNTKPYRVIYMNDGDTTFFRGGLAGQTWNLAATLAELYECNAIEPLIIVAIHPVDRNREYTHMPWSTLSCCAVEEYADYVTRRIKPFIDDNYCTCHGSDCNMIVGSSHGGLAAFFTANRFPESFGYVGALSPSFWVGLDDASQFPIVRARNDQSLRRSLLVRLLRDTLIDPYRRPRLYLDWGLVRSGGDHNAYIEERATARGREMAALLQQDYGYRLDDELRSLEDPLGDHREESWGRRMADVVRWFTRIP